MTESSYPRLSALFRFILSKSFWILGAYAILMIPSAYFALQVKQDNSPDRLMVQSDVDYKNHQAFENVFGKESRAFLFFEAKEPTIFTKEALNQMDEIEIKFSQIQGVETGSLLSLFRTKRKTPSSQKISFSDPTILAEFQKFAQPENTKLFIRQGLIDQAGTMLGMRLSLYSENTQAQHELVHKIDNILKTIQNQYFRDIRKVGQPYVNDYLDKDVRSASIKYFVLFGIFVIILNLFLYRSVRTLFAILIPLGVSTTFTVGFIGFVGGAFTLVSSLIPLTILITATATLVYIHSRFVGQPPERSVEEHQIFSLSNKFLACTASIFATAVGFAALVVSKIRPIREMGIWVAVGLVFTWLVTFTLFPALQKILQTPTQQKQKIAGQWFSRLSHALPTWAYRYRFFLVGATLLWCMVGAIALFGIPGLVSNMDIETNPVEYINHKSKLYKDTKRLEEDPNGGLAITELWLKQKEAFDRPDNKMLLFDADMMLALQDLQKTLQTEPEAPTVFGLPDVIDLIHYVTRNEPLPTDPVFINQFFTGMNMTLERSQDPQKAELEKALSHFVKFDDFAQIRITLRTKTLSYEKMIDFHQRVKQVFTKLQAKYPEKLQAFQLAIAGSGVLQVRVSHYMVPTLTESFGLTVVIIFVTFLFVFRSGSSRIMAMIPSLFAILAMFSIMRLSGITLNIATIVIASTVLGSSENDQIHFFYHYQEFKKAGGSTEGALKHAFLVAGQAIFFATLINAGGFLAFVLADLPPIREFGILSSLAFVLSMIADFTALPAALWLIFRDRPDSKEK